MQPNTNPFFRIISTLVLDALGVLTPNDAAGPYKEPHALTGRPNSV